MRIILISESGYNGSGYGICFPLPGYDKFVMIIEIAEVLVSGLVILERVASGFDSFG